MPETAPPDTDTVLVMLLDGALPMRVTRDELSQLMGHINERARTRQKWSEADRRLVLGLMAYLSETLSQAA